LEHFYVLGFVLIKIISTKNAIAEWNYYKVQFDKRIKEKRLTFPT